jgi:predicted Zn-dependent protease
LLHKAAQPERGQQFLERARELDGSKADYDLSLAQSQFMQGRVSDSIATLEAALAKHPDDERITYWLEEMRQAPAR